MDLETIKSILEIIALLIGIIGSMYAFWQWVKSSENIKTQFKGVAVGAMSCIYFGGFLGGSILGADWWHYKGFMGVIEGVIAGAFVGIIFWGVCLIGGAILWAIEWAFKELKKS